MVASTSCLSSLPTQKWDEPFEFYGSGPFAVGEQASEVGLLSLREGRARRTVTALGER